MKDGQKIQIHNWIIEKVEMDGVDFIEVRTVTGDFRVMYRIDHHMYGLLESVTGDTETSEALLIVFNNTFASASILDAELHKSILTAIDDLLNRSDKSSDISDEENKQTIAEEKTAYEMEKEMKEEQKDEE